jgi:hypothetical protein
MTLKERKKKEKKVTILYTNIIINMWLATPLIESLSSQPSSSTYKSSVFFLIKKKHMIERRKKRYAWLSKKDKE